jgi:hypothetical protein
MYSMWMKEKLTSAAQQRIKLTRPVFAKDDNIQSGVVSRITPTGWVGIILGQNLPDRHGNPSDF